MVEVHWLGTGWPHLTLFLCLYCHCKHGMSGMLLLGQQGSRHLNAVSCALEASQGVQGTLPQLGSNLLHSVACLQSADAPVCWDGRKLLHAGV